MKPTAADHLSYKKFGYTGFKLRYRETHDGEDPPEELMIALERIADRTPGMMLWKCWVFLCTFFFG